MNRQSMEGDGGNGPLGEVPTDERMLLGLGDPPAFLRRGMSVEDAELRAIKRCEAARDQMLYGVRLRLRFWNRLVRDNLRVRNAMSAAAKDYAAEITGKVFGPEDSAVSVAPTGWTIFASRHWRAFADAVLEFNGRWRRFLETLPLDDLHRTIEGYNRYYVIEKECAVRSARTARLGFVPKRKPTGAEFLERFPLLPTPPVDFR